MAIEIQSQLRCTLSHDGEEAKEAQEEVLRQAQAQALQAVPAQ